MESAEIEALFAATLLGDYDHDLAWEAVQNLRLSGSREVFEYAVSWCDSADPSKRARAADVLGQLGTKPFPAISFFPEERFQVLSKMLGRDHDEHVLHSAISSLGHLHDRRAISLVAPYAFHSSHAVRFSVAFFMGCFPDEPQAIQILLALMADIDNEIRDWATFGVGVQGSADTPQIREALAARLSDPDESTREEAVVGLAKRKDWRAVAPLRALLLDADYTHPRAIEAVEYILGPQQDARPNSILGDLDEWFRSAELEP